MNPIPIAIAGVLFILGIVVGRQTIPDTSPDTIQQDVPPTPTMEVVDIATPSSTLTPMTSTIEITPQPSPSSISSSTTSVSLSEFIYPGAQIEKEDQSHLELTSSASTQDITSWYEQQITILGFGSKAFAKTSSNGNIENKLAGSKQGQTISIVLTKNNSSAMTRIVVDVKQTVDTHSDVNIKIHNSSTTNEI